MTCSSHWADRPPRTVGQAAAIEAAETIVALCNGQIREMLDNFNPGRSEQSILDIDRRKDGGASADVRVASAGYAAAWTRTAIDALGAYGHAFGMSFQLVDDVLDFVSSQALTGKPVLNDLRCGVYTLPVALALREEYGRELFDALELAGRQRRGRRRRATLRLTDAQVDDGRRHPPLR